MIALAYAVVLVATAVWLGRYYRGRTVEGLIRNPPAGSDLNAIVSQLSYLEHELLKHRVPVVQSLLHKRSWNDDDFALLGRTVGRGDASMRAELQRYLDGIQRGAGRALVNFERDRAFTQAKHQVEIIQRAGERWLRAAETGGPGERERRPVEEACRWLSGPFRRYLIELNRSVFRCPISAERLRKSARRGLSEGGRGVVLTVAEPPVDCVANILPGDLDIAVRNLVRNAAQIALPEGRRPAVHLDVEEQLEETGEESVLIRVHDRSPSRLSSDQIYGREARRGLGLVTSALGRHRAAVRCVDSADDQFAKAMEIRLARSLHDPDPAALAMGRSGPMAAWRAAAAIAAHGILVGLVLVPWLGPHPLEAATLDVPAGCTAASSARAPQVTLRCDAVDAAGRLRREPLSVRFDSDGTASGRLEVTGDACVAVTRLGPTRVAVDLVGCFDRGRLAPAVLLRFESLWRRDAFEVRLDFNSSTARLLQAGRSALASGELDRARLLAERLLGAEQVGLSVSEEAEAIWLQARANVEEAARHRLGGDLPLDDGATCEGWHDTERQAARLLALAETLPPGPAGRLADRARLLLAEATLWLTASTEGALGLLETVLQGADPNRATQSTRLLAAVLISEGVSGPRRDPEPLLRALWETYARPPVGVSTSDDALTVQLAGLSVGDLGDGGIPVPELVCAFRSRYPDVRLPPAMVVALAAPCGRRPPDDAVDAYLVGLGRFVREGPRPIACP